MRKIPFSVAMSVYFKDRAEHFDRALESITAKQSLLPDEIVLIVDGPVGDDINKVIDKYTGRYDIFNIIRLEKNVGLGNALRIAVESSKNEYIARMDSDDVSVYDRFEQQIAYINKQPETDILGGDITEFIGEETNIVAKRAVPAGNEEIRSYMKKRCAFNHMTVMYKKSAVINAGNYIDWFYNEDYYLWIRMLFSGAVFANTGTVLVNVRTGDEMYSRRGGIRYFKSEAGLQKYMLENKIITFDIYLANIIKRFIVQLLLPNKVRAWVFKKFARTGSDKS